MKRGREFGGGGRRGRGKVFEIGGSCFGGGSCLKGREVGKRRIACF